MIDLTISCCPLNASLHILILQFTTAPWSNILKKEFNEIRHLMKYAKHAKHAILWGTPSTTLYEARQARQFYETHQARYSMEHSKHVSM